MIAVVDYKAGNLTSVMKALAAVGADAVSTDDPEIVRQAGKDHPPRRRTLPGDHLP